jgi:hypothetical protein
LRKYSSQPEIPKNPGFFGLNARDRTDKKLSLTINYSVGFNRHFAAMSIGVFHGVGAGLFNISAAFKYVGEPAPTGLLTMVQELYFN